MVSSLHLTLNTVAYTTGLCHIHRLGAVVSEATPFAFDSPQCKSNPSQPSAQVRPIADSGDTYKLGGSSGSRTDGSTVGSDSREGRQTDPKTRPNAEQLRFIEAARHTTVRPVDSVHCQQHRVHFRPPQSALADGQLSQKPCILPWSIRDHSAESRISHRGQHSATALSST